MTQAGPAIPVIAVTDRSADGGPALRVAVVSDGRATEGGLSRPVIVVSDGRPTQGNDPVPVVVATGAQAGRIMAGPAIPVYVVSGSLNPTPPSSLLTSIAAYWALEEASGTRVDATGRGNDLSPVNTPGNAAGKVGNGYAGVFANSTYLSLADSADLSMGDIDFTIACWVKFSEPVATTSGFITKWNDSANNREWFLGKFSSRFQFGISSNGTLETFRQATTFGAPLQNTWYFIVAWHDSVANTINIQVNDGVVDSTAYALGGRDGTAAFRLGAYRDTAFNFLTGTIDEPGVWKRVLTVAERTALYNSGNGRTYPFVGT